MGFYGRVVTGSSQNLQFDRTYPNKYIMDQQCETDNIFIGRRVMIDYDYSASEVKYLTNNNGKYSKIQYNNTIIYTATNEGYDTIFELNQSCDKAQNSSLGRGYDNTVWQKTQIKDKVKYIHIADLNSVVPEIEFLQDPPTSVPMNMHYDEDVANVKYTLHTQPTWGFRIAKSGKFIELKKTDNIEFVENFYYQFNENTGYSLISKDNWDKINNDTIIYYQQASDEEIAPWERKTVTIEEGEKGKEYVEKTEYANNLKNENGIDIPDWKKDKPNENIKAAIYYNEAGFDKAFRSRTGNDLDSIKLTPAYSGNEYHKVPSGASNEKECYPDTQELSINLPSIGNAISDVWDIVYGPNRSYAPGNEGIGHSEDDKKSLCGYMDNLNLESGEGKYSIRQKAEQSDNVDNTNKAITEYAIALGVANTVGSKGYYIASIDHENKAIYLSNDKAGKDTSVDTSGYAAGDKISIIAMVDRSSEGVTAPREEHWHHCAKIISVEGNKITYDVDLPFTVLAENDYEGYPAFTVNKKPTIGSFVIGTRGFAEGSENIVTGYAAHAEGRGNTAAGTYAHAEGRATTANYAAHAEGLLTEALGMYSHTEGQKSKTTGRHAHAEGYYTEANAWEAHAEGYYTKANGTDSHAEGYYTVADGKHAHAEGGNTNASGEQAHAEGAQTKAEGYSAHSEGLGTTAGGKSAHSEGSQTKANGEAAHSEGKYTLASGKYQHVQGRANIEDISSDYADIVGNGPVGENGELYGRSNAYALDWNGNGYFSGDVYANITKDEYVNGKFDAKKKLATKNYVDNQIINSIKPQQSYYIQQQYRQLVDVVGTVYDNKTNDIKEYDIPFPINEWLDETNYQVGGSVVINSDETLVIEKFVVVKLEQTGKHIITNTIDYQPNDGYYYKLLETKNLEPKIFTKTISSGVWAVDDSDNPKYSYIKKDVVSFSMPKNSFDVHSIIIKPHQGLGLDSKKYWKNYDIYGTLEEQVGEGVVNIYKLNIGIVGDEKPTKDLQVQITICFGNNSID